VKIAVLVAATAAAAMAGGFFILYPHGVWMQAAFDAVEPGASEEKVRVILGKPDREAIGCADHLYWGDDGHLLGGNDGSCHHSLWYDSFIEQWQVGFDLSDHAVHKYHYVCP